METKSEIDFGIDFSMFNSRLTASLDYYNRKHRISYYIKCTVPPNLYQHRS